MDCKIALPDLNRDPCRNSAGNSLKRKGKGGLANDEQKDDFIPSAKILTNAESDSDKIHSMQKN